MVTDERVRDGDVFSLGKEQNEGRQWRSRFKRKKGSRAKKFGKKMGFGAERRKNSKNEDWP